MSSVLISLPQPRQNASAKDATAAENLPDRPVSKNHFSRELHTYSHQIALLLLQVNAP